MKKLIRTDTIEFGDKVIIKDHSEKYNGREGIVIVIEDNNKYAIAFGNEAKKFNKENITLIGKGFYISV